MKKKEAEDVVTLEAPREKRAKLDPEMITVKEVCMCVCLVTIATCLSSPSDLLLLLVQRCSLCRVGQEAS